MVRETFQALIGNINSSMTFTVVAGLFILLALVSSASIPSKKVLPGIPELKGIPILGAAPIYLKYGMPELLSRLIAIGTDGISYANVVNNVLVSVHDPAMVREVLAYPEDIASREGNVERMSWSPFWTLRRLIGHSLFNYVGPETSHQRNVFIREFNANKANAEKFIMMTKIAHEHAYILTGEAQSAEVDDIRYSADNFAIALWGETLYGNPEHHVGGKVLSLSRTIVDLAGNPWPSVWYSLQLYLNMVNPGDPTRSESRIRSRVYEVVKRNIIRLEEYERENPEAPLKTIRTLSVMTGGGRSGPLSEFASEFTNLNIFGGHHSIGLDVTWALIELSKHPNCLAKLMTEINSVDIEDFASVNSKMPYLDAVLMEINRLHPTVHATLRVINRDTKLASSPKPVTLKAGMLIYLSYLHIHTSESYWGPTALDFDPDRFLGGYDKSKPFMAFGYGPRNCVGYRFAILAAKVYLATLLNVYRVDVKDHDHVVKLGTLLETTKPVAVKVTRR
ncbi:putative N-alkane-inducible cytochrome P450 [Thozetella sp. PMI_491]|nr:putative N-alkane-inducible cytochrome P450 [Thozetella sp. PMI_491]